MTEIPAVKSTPVEQGVVRRRRRFTTVPGLVSGNWTLTSTQAQALKTFYYTTSNYGTDWFNITLPFEIGSRTVEARFDKPLVWSSSGVNSKCSFSLEIREVPKS